MITESIKKGKFTLNVKKMYVLIAQYPDRWYAESALHSTNGRPVHFDINSTYLGRILATQQLRAKTIYSLTFPSLVIERYSFVQLSELSTYVPLIAGRRRPRD